MASAYGDLEDVARFGPRGKLPDKKTDPKGWNATWNRYLEWRFHSERASGVKIQPDWTPFFEIYDNPITRQTWLAGARDTSNLLLKMQVGITEYIISQREAFALEWLSMGSKQRLKHISSGLLQLCDTADYEPWRMFCPESTNAFLERDSGRGLLDLITTFFPPPQSKSETQAKRDKPVLLFHPQVNAVMGFDQPCPVGRDPVVWDLVRNTNECSRADFLCRMLFYIICDALDVVIAPVQMRKLGAGRKESQEFYSHLPTSVSSMEGFKKSVIDVGRAMQKKAVWSCTACGRSEDQLPKGTPFAFCVPCRALSRKVPYCNRECQIHDWKFGDPPHKTICGKPVSLPPSSSIVPLQAFDQAISSSEKDVFAIPPPDQGFIRSSALVSQILNLQNNGRADLKDVAYIFMKGVECSLICLYQDTWTAGYFRVFRNHAFRNGDHKAVAVMYKFLSQEAPEDMCPLHLILCQLCQEFGIEPKRLTELARDVPVRELSKRDRDKFLAEMDSILTPD